MTLDELHAQLVSKTRSMREAQRTYFRTRNPSALAASKSLEAQVDRVLSEIDRARSSEAKSPTFPAGNNWP